MRERFGTKRTTRLVDRARRFSRERDRQDAAAKSAEAAEIAKARDAAVDRRIAFLRSCGHLADSVSAPAARPELLSDGYEADR